MLTNLYCASGKEDWKGIFSPRTTPRLLYAAYANACAYNLSKLIFNPYTRRKNRTVDFNWATLFSKLRVHVLNMYMYIHSRTRLFKFWNILKLQNSQQLPYWVEISRRLCSTTLFWMQSFEIIFGVINFEHFVPKGHAAVCYFRGTRPLPCQPFHMTSPATAVYPKTHHILMH